MDIREVKDIFTVTGTLPSTLCAKLIDCYRKTPDSYKSKHGPREANLMDLSSQRDGFPELWQECFDALSTAVVLYKHHYRYFERVYCGGFSIVAYEAGEGCAEHYDGLNHNGLIRFASVVCYLNEDFEAGRTLFPRQNESVSPEARKVLIFPSLHTHPHSAEKTIAGTRYILLSSLLYDYAPSGLQMPQAFP